MKKTTKAFIFLSSASFIIAGLGVAACSSSTTTIVDDAGGGGMDGNAGGDSGKADGGGTDSGPGMDSAMAADCKPATLHAPDASAGPFCPFVNGIAPGANCASNEWCCKASGLGNGRCVASTGSTNPCMLMETALECDENINCNAGNGGPHCCGTGTVKQDPSCAGTTAYFGSGFNSTKCQATCAAGELQMCSNPAECADAGGGATNCTAFKARGGQFGACQP